MANLTGFRDPYAFNSPHIASIIDAGSNVTNKSDLFITISGGVHGVGAKLFLYRQAQVGNVVDWDYLGPLVEVANKTSFSPYSGSESNSYLSPYKRTDYSPRRLWNQLRDCRRRSSQCIGCGRSRPGWSRRDRLWNGARSNWPRLALASLGCYQLLAHGQRQRLGEDSVCVSRPFPFPASDPILTLDHLAGVSSTGDVHTRTSTSRTLEDARSLSDGLTRTTRTLS
jgi:hypothetical protein